MLTRKAFLVAYRVFFALLGFAAIITEIAVIVERGTFNPANFFSFFTIQTNILVFFTFLAGAVLAHSKQSRQFDTLRAAVALYAIVVGIVFSALLSGYEALTAVPWDNLVLHYIIPIAVVIDFLVDRPRRIGFASGLWWLVYPVTYAAYSLVRGAMVGWYPYPFLNPEAHGYSSVIAIVLGLTLFGTILVAIITRLTVVAPRGRTAK